MKKIIYFVVLGLIIQSCGEKATIKKPSEAEIAAESKKANEFFDKVFDEQVDRSPMYQSYLGIKKDYDKWDDISDENEKKEYEILEANLRKLTKEIDKDKLDDQTKLSYRLYLYNAQMEKEQFEYRFYSYPVNQMFGLHSELPSFLINIHQIKDSADARAYIARLEKVNTIISQLIVNVRLRADKGILPPKFVFPKVIEDCRNILKGAPFEKSNAKSTLLEDFISKVEKLDSISPEIKKGFIKDAENALLKSVQPAYVDLIKVLGELEIKANVDDGVWKFQDGEKFYKMALRHTTTTDLSPEEIYQTGLKEVSRIQGEMRKIMKEVNYPGDSLQQFFKSIKEDKKFYYSNDEAGKKLYLSETNAIIDTMRLHLDELFITKPKAGLIVKPVESFREKSTGTAFYQDPAPDGSRPGIYYVNLFDMSAVPKYEMEALAYHEAIPGHHMQLSIAQELQNVPKFRKYGNYTAYVEGWGLYTEAIPKEMGFYKDPYSNFGRLSLELWRACRLVVDVGLHVKKWDREKAVAYLMANTPTSEVECRKSIDRYIVMPTQATAYKVGMMKIQELRESSKAKLKEKFDIREFHDVVLKYGAVPLDILEENIEIWVKGKN